MILNQITPTGSKTFDTAFTKACKLIHDTSPRYYEFYSEGIDTKKHYYDDFIIKALQKKTIFSLDDIGLILNALMNGYNASNPQYPFRNQTGIEDNLDLIIKIYKFITNTDKTRSKMKPFLELYSKQHNSISINNICSLLENNVPWPFAHEATWLSPVSMNTLLAKYPANDNWWLERFYYNNNNKLTPIQSFDAIRLSRIIDNTNKLDDNDKKALIIKLFTNNLPINTCLLDSIIDYYDNAFTSTRLLVKAFTEFIHCESVERSIMVVDDNTAEQCIHDASRFFHSKKNLSILNKSCKGSIIRLLANVINDNSISDMTRMILFRVLNTIYLVYEHYYESFYDYSYSESVLINMNIFNMVNCRAILKNYPEIIHDIIYYPIEYVEESIKNLGSIL